MSNQGSKGHPSVQPAEAWEPPVPPAGVPSPENQSSGFFTEELRVAATPHYHQNPRAMDFPCILKLWGPQ